MRAPAWAPTELLAIGTSGSNEPTRSSAMVVECSPVPPPRGARAFRPSRKKRDRARRKRATRRVGEGMSTRGCPAPLLALARTARPSGASVTTMPSLTLARGPTPRARRMLPSARPMTPEQIARACEGDDGLLGTLVDEILPAIRLEVTFGLRRRARLFNRDANQDVDDFVQDVMVHLLGDGGKRLRAWDPARGRSLRSFVRLIARHRLCRVLEGFRGNPWEGVLGGESELDDVDADAPAFERLLSRQQLERLLDMLRARFNERSMVLFERLYIEQRPVAEVCETLGMSRAAVDQWNVRLRRLVRTLADELDRGPPEASAGSGGARTRRRGS